MTLPGIATIPRLSQAAGLELAARRIVEGLYVGRHRSPYTGPATEFNDHRAYQPGDDLRSVDWKAYGRSDHLLIRRYREERDLPLALVLDTSASMAYGAQRNGAPDKSTWAGLAAAVLGLLALDQSDRVRLVAGSADIEQCSAEHGGAAGAAALVYALAELTWRGAGDLPRLLTGLGGRLTRRTLVVVISDLICSPAELVRPLGALAARGHDLAVIQVLDRAEISLPADWGLSRLSDPEGRISPLTCDADAAKDGYDEAVRGHLAECRRVVAGCRGDHVLGVTDQPVVDVLGGWLHRRRVRR